MFTAFETVKNTHTYAQGGIHYLGGVYSTGMTGWPEHELVVSTSSPSNSPITSSPSTSEPTDARKIPTPMYAWLIC